MKYTLIAAFIFLSSISFGQSHSEKLQIANDSAFMAKVTYAAYGAAKAFVADTEANANVKRFSQIIIADVANLNPSIIVGRGYYLQSIPATVVITINSSQNDISFGMPHVYQLFAKAWYKDLN